MRRFILPISSGIISVFNFYVFFRWWAFPSLFFGLISFGTVLMGYYPVRIVYPGKAYSSVLCRCIFMPLTVRRDVISFRQQASELIAEINTLNDKLGRHLNDSFLEMLALDELLALESSLAVMMDIKGVVIPPIVAKRLGDFRGGFAA